MRGETYPENVLFINLYTYICTLYINQATITLLVGFLTRHEQRRRRYERWRRSRPVRSLDTDCRYG